MGSLQATAIPNSSAVSHGAIRTTSPPPVILNGRELDPPDAGGVMVNSTRLRRGIKQADSRSKPHWLMFLVTASTSAIASPEVNFTWENHSRSKRRNFAFLPFVHRNALRQGEHPARDELRAVP
jgi:hypothetical protein